MKKFYIAAYTVCFLLIFYFGAWIYSALWFSREIDNLYANAKEEGVAFLGPKPTLTNFPFVPEVKYTNGIATGNAEFLFPSVVLHGYPIPFTKLKLRFPQGVSLGGIVDPRIWTLDLLEADLIIPAHLPQSLTQEELSAWKDEGGKIDITNFHLARQSLKAEGKGSLQLDPNLQPDFEMQAAVKDWEPFIREQIQAGIMEPFPGALGITMLNALAKDDPETLEKTVTVDVKVKDRMLTAGPLTLPLPEIKWE
jgi:hypothetical protein